MFKTGCLLKVRYRLEKAFCHRLFLDGSAIRHTNFNKRSFYKFCDWCTLEERFTCHCVGSGVIGENCLVGG